MFNVCPNCQRVEGNGLPVCACGFSFLSGSIIKPLRPAAQARSRMRHWKRRISNFNLDTRGVVIGIAIVLFAVVGLSSVLVDRLESPKAERNTRLWSLSDPVQRTTNQTESTAGPAVKNVFEGKVTAVRAGDAITVVDNNSQQHHIKLSGVVAPALTVDAGRQAQNSVSKLIFEKRVRVVPQAMDVNNVVFAKVLLDGRNVGLELISAGLAWHNKNSEIESGDRRIYEDAEVLARTRKLGVWSTYDPPTPQVPAPSMPVEIPAEITSDLIKNERPPKEVSPKMKAAETPVMKAETPKPVSVPEIMRNAPTVLKPVASAPKAIPTFTKIPVTVPVKTAPPAAVVSNAKVYILGPRGGCYYLNSKGSKSYVDKSLCK